ncbi:hypothetical protein DFH06DRAFT_1122788 [Mycena polygramma]|nr:hypothetical protein DFH06DRAFT_1122788 [Mycena polygramma]
MSVPVDSSVTRTSRCWPASRRRTFSAAVKEAELSPSLAHELGSGEQSLRNYPSTTASLHPGIQLGKAEKSRAVSHPRSRRPFKPQVLHAVRARTIIGLLPAPSNYTVPTCSSLPAHPVSCALGPSVTARYALADASQAGTFASSSAGLALKRLVGPSPAYSPSRARRCVCERRGEHSVSAHVGLSSSGTPSPSPRIFGHPLSPAFPPHQPHDTGVVGMQPMCLHAPLPNYVPPAALIVRGLDSRTVPRQCSVPLRPAHAAAAG